MQHAEGRGPAAYDDREAMMRALDGADTVFLVSAHLSGRRLEEHVSAVEAARTVGVRRVVYLSLLGAARDATYVNARDHAATEEYLDRSGLAWTVLRPAYYSQMLLRFAEDGVVRGPGGAGRCSFVGHDDLAEVAVAVLDQAYDGRFDGAVLPVTGPEAVTLDAACAAAGLRYDDAEADGEPDRVTWFRSIARGEVAEVAGTVARLTGHPARAVGDVLG